MNATIFMIFCTAFVAGAYASTIPNFVGVGLALGLGAVSAYVLPKYWKESPKFYIYLAAGAIAAFACLYVMVRTPAPSSTDISQFAPLRGAVVRGVIQNSPSRGRSDRVRFHLEVREFKKSQRDENFIPASGTLYVTVPLLEGTGRRRGDELEITGNMYKPSGASNPGGFDFRQFLARQGIFAGMTGQRISPEVSPPRFGEWWITGRIIKAHVTGAGMPEGALLSSLVLGGRAVDLPPEVRDTFVKAGLAAMLAASGFHVSIILGSVLGVVGEANPKKRMVVGILALLGYAILTGGSPSIIRATIMGAGGLVGLAYEKKIRPLAGLAAAAALLLLWQPLWIYDLGFQFSFLATLGLMVSANAVQQRLQWLPPNLASALSVPIAAVMWTLPLQLYVFGRISIYCILANVLTTPIISFCIIGGVLSGLAGVIFLPLGAGLTWLLRFPLWLTITIAEWTNSLPGAVTNTGAIELWQLLSAYAIFLVIWLYPKLAKWWLPAGMVVTLLVFAPGAIARANLFQVTLLATSQVPAMVIQNQGQTALINSGSNQDVQFTVFPFLQKSGVNALDKAIATSSQPKFVEGWQILRREGIGIKELQSAFGDSKTPAYQLVEQTLTAGGTKITSLSPGQKVDLMPAVAVEVIETEPLLMTIQTADTTWLLMGRTRAGEQGKLVLGGKLPKANVLWWSGEALDPKLVQAVKPQFLIASTNNLTEEVRNQLRQLGDEVRVLVTGRDGAISWTPVNGIEPLKEVEDSPL